MSAFKFRLEKVLNVREIMEERAKQEWAIQERLAQQECLNLKHLEEEKGEVRNFGYKQPDLKLRQAMYTYLNVLEQRIERQEARVNKQKLKASEAKNVWLLARQETKKVSTLREKQYASFLKEEQRKEQKILDDMRSYLKG